MEEHTWKQMTEPRQVVNLDPKTPQMFTPSFFLIKRQKGVRISIVHGYLCQGGTIVAEDRIEHQWIPHELYK